MGENSDRPEFDPTGAQAKSWMERAVMWKQRAEQAERERDYEKEERANTDAMCALLTKERDEARAKVERLTAALEPGKASGIVAGLFALAQEFGLSPVSSEAPTTYLRKLILSLQARAALEDK